MKRIILIISLISLAVMSANAQYHGKYPRAYLEGYRYQPRHSYQDRFYARWNHPYVGLRIGPSFTTVHSDDPYLDGSNMKAGLNVGIATGFPLSSYVPLYLETGLYYTEKGGRGTVGGSHFKYNLDYLGIGHMTKEELRKYLHSQDYKDYCYKMLHGDHQLEIDLQKQRHDAEMQVQQEKFCSDFLKL